ncbi:hypothetical protein [Marinicella gelatinilytica]|uniref:hypothetical protein n=1 Tax=Marinicella gelatinilytica TaxID=2996017 RepID=UPI002260B22E|nr:hypothetical protein [Marinicella gelatinilytica]MCX7545393.1 hypothetical protein [Marinicella gelatinilytica]
MKKLVLLSLSLLLFAGMASAERGKAMFDELNLTEQQRTEVETLMADHHKRMADAREQVKTETHDKLADILSEEQMQQWQEMKAEKQQRMQKRHKKMKHKRQYKKGKMDKQSENTTD